jgi:hypothetical protein
MEITIDIVKLTNKNTKIDKTEIPNLSRLKNQIPSMIKILKLNDDTYEPAQNIDFKIWCNGHDLHEYKESYFLLYNYISLDDFKSILNTGQTCEFSLKSYNSESSDYRVIITYVESFGCIIYEDKILSTRTLFKDIKVQGNMTQLFLIFNKKITDLQLVPVISADIDENEPWIYAIDFETTEDGQYMIDFTGDKAIYDRFSQFLKLQYEIVDKEDLDNFKINVVVYGYKK